MEAYNRFTKCIFKWERSMLKFVGHDLLDVELKRTPVTFIIYGTIFGGIVMEIYTFIYYDAFEKIFCLNTFALTFQVRLKSSTRFYLKFEIKLMTSYCRLWQNCTTSMYILIS